MSFLTSTARVFFRHFDEQVTYYPRVGAPRVIRANVIRNVPQTAGEAQVLTHFIQVDVRNLNQSAEDDADGIGGISSSEIDTGGDTIELAPRIGGTAKRVAIKSILSQDEGCMSLEVR